jgi:iron complex transport system substrate-binding protein
MINELMMKKISKYFLLCSLVLSSNVFGRTITDMAGRKVVLPESIESVYSDRFVSLIVFALDQHILCNRTFQLTDEAKKFISADYWQNKPFTKDADEELLKLHPDVLIYARMGGRQAIDEADRTQKRLHIPVLLIDFQVQDYPAVFSFLGQALGREAKAKPIEAFLNKYVQPIRQKASTIPAGKRPRVYYAEGVEGLNTEPAGSFHSQVLDFLSVRNVAKVSIAGVHGMSPVSMEQVLVWNPDVVLVWTGYPGGMTTGIQGGSSKGTYSHIKTDPTWSKIQAVIGQKVYQIPSLPFGWFDRPPSSNCLPGVFWTAKMLYPGVFDFDLSEVLKDYYRLFYHVILTDDHVRYLLNH